MNLKFYAPIVNVELEPESRMEYLSDDIVDTRTSIEIEFDYPLEKAARLTFKSTNGFTKRQLAHAIADGYQQIYNEDAVDPEKYGIWGHHIHHLYLVWARLDNDGVWQLDIDS